MSNQEQHFVYAIDNGTYDASGTPIRIFGISTLDTLPRRYKSYQLTASKRPILSGVIPCNSKDMALATESAILKRFSEDAPKEIPRSEVRLATSTILEFIETEMENGEAFLGMSCYEYCREKRRKESQRPDVKEATRKYNREYYHRRRHKRTRPGKTSANQLSLF